MSDAYSSERVLREYLLFHYGAESEILSLGLGPREGLGFAERTVTELLDASSLQEEGANGLDLGCAVGRSSFELARHCLEVTGIDFSLNFIRVAEVLRDTGELAYEYVTQGERLASAIARIPKEVNRSRVNFVSGDACDLPRDCGTFDVVHAANLLCRLPDPCALLGRLPDLVRPGGQLLLATPFSWLEEFTPRDKWVGGLEGTETESTEALKATLLPSFHLEKEMDLPFLLREHERKFQYGISLGTRWRRGEG